MRFTLLCVIALLLSACMSSTPAPVVNAWLEPQQKNSDYIVHSGDTIYSIAWQFGLNYVVLAQVNHLQYPYRIYSGQHLKMSNVARGIQTTQTPSVSSSRLAPTTYSPPKTYPVKTIPKPPKQHPKQVIEQWQWPASGTVIQKFSLGLEGNPGINISGNLDAPVRAALSGEIVYCSNGVHGYHNLIIIKHNPHYLSAYAYNQKILVHLGQRVKAGDRIAAMGSDPAGRVMLHFEIRYDGQPVDPLKLLR